MYSRLLLQESDYQSLEKFLIKSYNEFRKDKLFDRSNHNDKLRLTGIEFCQKDTPMRKGRALKGNFCRKFYLRCLVNVGSFYSH